MVKPGPCRDPRITNRLRRQPPESLAQPHRRSFGERLEWPPNDERCRRSRETTARAVDDSHRLVDDGKEWRSRCENQHRLPQAYLADVAGPQPIGSIGATHDGFLLAQQGRSGREVLSEGFVIALGNRTTAGQPPIQPLELHAPDGGRNLRHSQV